jgi:glycosyltransferase involved in cell wall biosynthesis
MDRSGRLEHPKVIAAIPCYNEVSFIGEVVLNAKKYVDQVIVIDDGSNDGTSETARSAGASVISHGTKRGAGTATKSCFEAARLYNADILVTLDGDGQHDPAEVSRIVKPILEGEADLVIGSRFLNGHSRIPRYRKVGIEAINLLYNLGSKSKLSDTQSCFRVYGKKAIHSLNVTESGFGFSVELLLEARRKQLAITERPIVCLYHSASHTQNPLRHGLNVAFTVVKLRLKYSLKPRGSN